MIPSCYPFAAPAFAALFSLALQWNFDGERTVLLDTPINIQGKRYGEAVELLGAGGSGAVFKLENQFAGHNHASIALKVSWDSTGDIIRKECATLKQLEGTPNVPRCVDLLPYYSTTRETDSMEASSKRTMMVLTPVVDDVATSFDDLNDPNTAASQIVETTVDMLRIQVYTVDVQWLLSKKDSSVLFIDFTERTNNAGAFLAEVVAGIPSDLRPVALSALRRTIETHSTAKSAVELTSDFKNNLDLFVSLLDGD